MLRALITDDDRQVAQPHRVYISGEHMGVRSALTRAESDYRRIERIWEAVLKQPSEFRVGNRTLYFDDFRFEGVAHELWLSADP